MPADQVVDVAEGARLAAVAEDRDRAVGQRLAQEGRDRAAVVRAHARAVGVEDPHDRRVHALLAVVGHRQRLGVALGLVVDAARADRVDVAPVVLGLRVDLRVAVDLARRRQQEAGAVRLGQPERVMRAVRADLQRVQRQAQVVDRRRRARRGGRRRRPARRRSRARRCRSAGRRSPAARSSTARRLHRPLLVSRARSDEMCCEASAQRRPISAYSESFTSPSALAFVSGRSFST